MNRLFSPAGTRSVALLAINLLMLTVWGFSGIAKVRGGYPAWFPDKFGNTVLATLPGLRAAFWLLTLAEVFGLALAVAALARGEFLGRRPPVLLRGMLGWSLLVFVQLGFGQWLTSDFNGTAQLFAYFSGTLVALMYVEGRPGPGELSMHMKRLLRIALRTLAVLVLGIGLIAGAAWAYFHPAFTRAGPIVYGTRHGRDLTLEVVRPRHPNGLGVILMVSGGWKSGTNAFRPWMAAPLLRRGYTVIPVCHVSQPTATVMEIFEDVSRGVRFVRHHARDYGVDPDRLGVTGGSAGGHLSLMMATRGGPGPATAADPVDRESSAVQAVAIFYPVTDLLNLGDSTENLHDGGPPKSFVKAFGPDSTNRAVWAVIGRDLSPIAHVTPQLPPTLIYHGDADTLVPLDQSQRFQSRARELGRTVEVVVHRGGRHGWLTMLWDVRSFGLWFDRFLAQGAGSR